MVVGNSNIGEDKISDMQIIPSLLYDNSGKEPRVTNEPNGALSDNMESDEEENILLSRPPNRKSMIISDDEDGETEEIDHVDDCSKNDRLQQNTSDEDSNDSLSTNPLKKKKHRLKTTADSDSEDETQTSPKSSMAPQYRSDIFDTQTSDEDESNEQESEREESSALPDCNENITKKVSKNRAASQKARELVAQEIRSESQRLVRESCISLPYHKPKQRSLKEFLNRKRYSFPINPGGSLKMTRKDMKHLDELEERQNNIEEFYKSESNDDKLQDKSNQKEKSPSETLKDSNKLAEEIDAIDITLQDKEYSGNGNQDTKTDTMAINGVSSQSFTDEGIFSQLESIDSQQNPGKENLVSNSSNQTELVSKILEHSEKDENFEDDSENDFHLHLNTEDFLEEEVTAELSGTKQVNQDDHSGLSDKQNTSIPVDTSKKNSPLITPKLKFLKSKFPDLDLSNITNFTPKISHKPDIDFIDLDEVDTTVQPQSSMSNFMDRFVKHSSAKRKPIGEHKETLAIISKEKSENGEEKLVSSSITINLKGEEEAKFAEDIPGDKLLKLKTTLKAQLLKHREKERQRRVKEKQFIECEEVIRDDGTDALPLEEEEMTDMSDTEGETESEPEEEDVVITEKKRERNMFIDDEAEEEDVSGDDLQDDMQDADDDRSGIDESESEISNHAPERKSTPEEQEEDGPPKQRKRVLRIEDDDVEEQLEECAAEAKEQDFRVKYDKGVCSDDEMELRLHWEETQDATEDLSKKESSFLSTRSLEDLFTSQVNKKDQSIGGLSDHSFEVESSLGITCYQPGGGFKRGAKEPEEEAFHQENNTSFHSLEESNKFTKDLSFNFTPFKDTQTPSSKISALLNESKGCSLDPQPFEESSQSNVSELLSLCSGKFTDKTQSSSSKISALLDESSTLALGESHTDATELLDLCSGNFKDSQEKKNDDLYQDVNFAPTQNIRDLVGFCSGQFPSEKPQASGLDEASHSQGSAEEEENTTGRTSPRKRKRVFVYSSDEEGTLERQGDRSSLRKRKKVLDKSEKEDAMENSDSDEEEAAPKKFSGFKVNGGIRAEFLEKEAELSGSEDSEDEEEPNEEEDIMEFEEGDTERFDEEELREQVGRAHLKSVIDNDKRELRLLQEMYFEDGDLHGEGRQRKFRWRNIGEENMEERRSEDETDTDNESEEDSEWRKQRIEREKFFQEQQQSGKGASDILDDPASLFKSSSLKIVRSQSFLSNAKRGNFDPANRASSHNSSLTFLQDLSLKRGSFMSKDKEALKRIAEMTKENHTVGGAKQGGNFIFHSLSAEEIQKKTRQAKEVSSTPSITQSCPKRTRLQRSFFSLDESRQSSSIFKHL